MPMLDRDEAAAITARFGASEEQVRRDHLISHLLAALSAHVSESVVFFGGTALARAHLPDGRLSEDIDLIAVGDTRALLAERVETAMPRALRREFPRLAWRPPLSRVRQHEPAVLAAEDGTTVRFQLLDPVGYPPWPTEYRDLYQRYRDAPPARLRVPTLAAFAAWKTVAWLDRGAARDLFDLWLLATAGAIDAEAANLFARYGPTNRRPDRGSLGQLPDEGTWRRELAGQTRLAVSAADALRIVQDAWARA